VYIADESEAPDDAIVRRGDRGRLYYSTDERGDNNEVGGNHENDLLEGDVDKQDTLSEGEVFYDTENETEILIAEVDGDDVRVTTGSHEWTESAQSAMNNIDNGSWVHLPDEERTVERQDDEEDPCWEGYEMVGMKPAENGEGEVPNCVPEDEVENSKEALERADDGETIGKPFSGPEGQGPFEDFSDCVSEMDGEVEDAEGWCAWAHEQDTGEWPAEKSDTLELSDSVPDGVVVKVYVDDPSDVPEGHIVEHDANGFHFKEQAHDLAAASYPQSIVEEYDYEMPSAEGDDEAGDPPTEEEYIEEQQELFDELEERYGEDG